MQYYLVYFANPVESEGERTQLGGVGQSKLRLWSKPSSLKRQIQRLWRLGIIAGFEPFPSVVIDVSDLCYSYPACNSNEVQRSGAETGPHALLHIPIHVIYSGSTDHT